MVNSSYSVLFAVESTAMRERASEREREGGGERVSERMRERVTEITTVK